MRTRAGEPGLRLSLDDTILHLRLADGRSADVPPAAFERLRKAPRDQLENWEIIGECEGVNWPDIDDEISIKG